MRSSSITDTMRVMSFGQKSKFLMDGPCSSLGRSCFRLCGDRNSGDGVNENVAFVGASPKKKKKITLGMF